MNTMSRRGWSGLSCCAALLLLACDQAPVVESDLPFQPPVMRETTPAATIKDAPTLSSKLEPGECATQDDCADGEVCRAVELGIAECEPADATAIPTRAPNGRPGAPVGLLDGQVMRDHAQRSAR
ncbi:MAG TPA: hypothetical protein VK509_11540 [Polyangiales bacterium]|nr:hypothetical protein [Polyangiales bacterium]